MAKKLDRGFIVRVREQLMNLEVSNDKYKLQSTGIKNLSEFCRIVNLNYSFINRGINNARDNEEASFEINGWTFTWMTIDEFHAYLETKNIPTNTRMMWIRGRVPTEVKNAPSSDRPFMKQLLEFIS